MTRILKRKRLLSLVLALSLLITLMPPLSIPGYSEELTDNAELGTSDSGLNNYGAAIGAVAQWNNVTSVLLASNHFESKGDVCAGVSVNALPKKLAIVDYAYNDANAVLWYKVDAAPGYTWPEEYANYHWVDSYTIRIVSQNGMTGVFDADGNAVTELSMGVYDTPVLAAESSLQGSVAYQWQIEYEDGKWVDIYGEDEAEITLSIGMIATLLVDDSVNVRCVSTSATKTAASTAISVTVAPTFENTANITVNGKETKSAELADKDYYLNSENGVEVTLENGILDLSVNTNLTGDDVTYQWQGLSGEEWVTLSTSKDYQLTFSDLMFAGACSGSTAYIRVVVTQGEIVVQSEQLIVTIVEAVTQASTLSLSSTSYSMASTPKVTLLPNNSGINTVAEETNTVLVTVQFVMGNNTAPIENGLFTYNVPYNGSVSDNIILPEVQGYAAYLGDDTDTVYSGTYALNLTNVTENTTITFHFWPAEVDYKVVYMQQNVSDDGYTIVRTDELKGLTGSDPVVGNVYYEGFVLVWCSTDKIASDGSTVIEVKYDRLYFKMLFNLDGGYGVQPVYARYGTPVTVNNPTKAGYSFMGWNALNGPYNTSDNEDTADIGAFTNIKIPAEHTNYKAIWKASDDAKVTVVIWGQKADNSDNLTDPNSYAYMSKTEGGKDLTNLYFNAKPGTSVTYNPTTGGYICGHTEEHIHGEGDCEATCGKTAHTHSDVGGDCYELTCSTPECTQHGVNCYGAGIGSEFVAETLQGYIATTRVRGTSSNGYIGIKQEAEFSLLGRISWNDTEEKYIYIEGTWYAYTGTANVGDTVQPSCHVHNDACYTFGCDIEVHAHEASCYAGCTKEEHTHSESCTLSIPVESNLWEFDHATPVTVAADGTSTLNVYYRRTKFTLTFVYDGETVATINEKWGTNIKARFDKIETDTIAKLSRNEALAGWRDSTTTKYTNYVGIMPKINKTFTANIEDANEDSNTMTYYFENLSGDYEEGFKIVFRGNGYTVTTDEYYEIEGFEINKSKSTSTGSSCKGAKFYYTREDYHLVFDNYGTTFKNELVLYEAPLSGYAADAYKVPNVLAPAYYQPGSVTFAGWYAAPQTPGDFNFESVEPFDFANSAMPASDLKLYAWWKPVSHQVTFYYDYAALQAGTIHTVDGEAQTFPVPHGSKIQDPYTPPKDPTSSYYEFEGWVYRAADGTEILWDFDNSTVTENVNLYGKWKSTTPAEYSVYFVTVINGKEVQIAEPEIGMALGGTPKTFDAKFNEDLYDGYQDRYYPRDMSHTITINLEDTSKNTFKFYYDYVKSTSYTIKYLEAGTDRPMSEIDSTYPAERTVSNNTHAMVTETFVAIPGYLPDAYQKVCKIDPDGTNEIIFYYTKDNKNGLWTVHYWLENLDGTYTEAADMLFTGTAKAGSTVTAPTDTVIENYYYYAAHKNNVSTGTASIDTVTHLHMYYNRTVHDYTVQYLEAGTNKELADKKVVNDLKWGTLVTEYADDKDVKIDFNIYQVYGNAEKTLEISVDETENVITFYYTEKRVTLNYAVVGPGKVEPNSESLQILGGKASGSTASTDSNAYKFVGWFSDAGCKNKISDSATYVPTKTDGTRWVDGTTYYAKFEYNLTSLTIQKQGHDSIDENQTFLFEITDEDGFKLTVTVHGNGAVTVDGLAVGKQYTIVEITDWSWRYTNIGVVKDSTTVMLSDSSISNGASFSLNATENVITFANTRSNLYWLDGDSWCNNIFKQRRAWA